MSGRVGGCPIRRRSARQKFVVKPYDPAVLQRHFADCSMHVAIKRRNFVFVQELLDDGDKFCRREGLNCYKLAEDDTFNSSIAANGLHGALSKMHLAIACRDFELVQRLLNNGDAFCTADGTNCFILAANDGINWETQESWEMLKKMLRIHYCRGILARDGDGLTLLNYFWTDLDIVKQLIDLGVDLNAVNKAGQTLCLSLFWAPLQNALDDEYSERDHLPQFWNLMMSYEEFQQQFVEPTFFKFLVQLMKKSELCQVLFFKVLQKLINIDLNFVNEYGKKLLKFLFCSDLSHKTYTLHDERLKLWNMLMKYQEFQNQVKEIDPEVPFSHLGQSELAKKMFNFICISSLTSVDQLTIKMKMHPLFYIMEKNKCSGSSFLYLIDYLLAENRKEDHNSILKDKTILISKDVSSTNVKTPALLKVKEKLNIPDNVTFDAISFFLYSLPKYYGRWGFNINGKGLAYYLKLLLENGFVPVGKPGVVHPIHALLYNILQHLDDSSPDLFQKDCLDPKFLLEAIVLLKDFPIPHQQVLDPETGHVILDVHLLLNSLVTHHSRILEKWEIGTPFLDCVKAFIPLSPLHPLQHFTSFYVLESEFYRRYYFMKTYCQFLLYTFEVCGRHKFQAIDQKTIESVNLFFEDWEKLEPDAKENLQSCGLLMNTSTKAESKVGSLHWLCILQIRKTLFLQRSSTSASLPSLIRTLIAEGHLPKGLEADLLMYEPNEKLNI